ncbi:MAG: HU family DNA-binding protein [Spirochaetales bacterium]|nr:HU family DNA-binding protein [Spirochaetales bacterium]
MIKNVAAHNDTTQTAVKAIVDDFLGTVEAGVLLGKRVSIGGLGRLELSVKPARKARMGRNPATGEEILIPSKPATSAPKMSFGSAFKERSSRVPPERIRPDLAEEETES